MGTIIDNIGLPANFSVQTAGIANAQAGVAVAVANLRA